MNDKITYQYEYIDSGGWMTTTSVKDAMDWVYHNTMVLFLNQYMTVAKRNEIVHNLPNIYK